MKAEYTHEHKLELSFAAVAAQPITYIDGKHFAVMSKNTQNFKQTLAASLRLYNNTANAYAAAL